MKNKNKTTPHLRKSNGTPATAGDYMIQKDTARNLDIENLDALNEGRALTRKMVDLEEVSKPSATMSVIFPTFNEEGNIRRTVEEAVKVLSKVVMSWEIIVVDDGSSDTTAAICDDLKARYPEVEVISHGQNRGYGAALKSGIIAAKYDLIFFSDSDGQFELRELEHLICWAEDYDIVAGYRAKRQDSLHRRINALGWNVLVRLMLGIKIRDIDCAFELFRRAFL